jgi:hypothetical protein
MRGRIENVAGDMEEEYSRSEMKWTIHTLL